MRIQTKQNSAHTKKLKESKLPKPEWLKIRPPTSDKFANIKALLKKQNLHTVCAEASCPNITECWSGGTATFMILGDTCTRACRFCNIKTGNPKGKIDPQEPAKLVESIKIMNLEYVVITCVTRDDLPDGGAQHFANCITTIKNHDHKILVEVLISDLNGNKKALETLVKANPDVLAHNLETVERLQKEVRDPRANYKKSLAVLEEAKTINPNIPTKTSLMLGLGETEEEVIKTMKDLRSIKADIITFGQYLQPSPFHLPVQQYIRPEQFKHYEALAKKQGFLYCASGPLVRSSYRAGEYYIKNKPTK